MALIRILVDGYSLLHNWRELVPGRAAHSAEARDELIHRLTLYRDSAGTPISIFFDGMGAPKCTPAAHSRPELEVLFSRDGRTADDLIERAAHRLLTYGEVLVVTDDVAERETVLSLGASVSNCRNFIRAIEDTMKDLAEDIKHHNRRERNHFGRKRPAIT